MTGMRVRVPVGSLAAVVGMAVIGGEPRAALAQTFSFNYTGSIETWNVPSTGVYRITAIGGNGASNPNSSNAVGGRGASIAGDIALTANTSISILVGGRGLVNVTQLVLGGGGGSFVAIGSGVSAQPLVVAGGGGSANLTEIFPGKPGQITRDGQAGDGDGLPGAGGTSGFGGAGLLGISSGGGGFFSNGGAGFPLGGRAFVNGGAGGTYIANEVFGGFGGGGVGTGNASGGGGGYSGGGGSGLSGAGGGGGSFLLDSALNPVLISGANFFGDGNGSIEITLVPTPGAVGLMATGGLMAMRRRRSRC